MDPDLYGKRPSQEQLVENARGLALAAFASGDVIARLLGCSKEEAAAFKEDAFYDFKTLMLNAQGARGRG